MIYYQPQFIPVKCFVMRCCCNDDDYDDYDYDGDNDNDHGRQGLVWVLELFRADDV